MIYHIKFDMDAICKRLIIEQLNKFGLNYSFVNFSEIYFKEVITQENLITLNNYLTEVGVELITSQKNILVQKIKQAILELVSMEDKLVFSKTSHHLSKTLNLEYRHLADIFSETTYTTIENFIILQKIERAKDMIAGNELTFTEIAWKLNYSSVGHFSMQFKNTTGFTPTLFKKIITQKQNNLILATIN